MVRYLLIADEKQKMTLSIHGINYSIRTAHSKEQAENIADYVNEKMAEVEKYQPNLNYRDVAVLAALNISEEYLNLKEEYEQLLEIINEN